MTSFLWSLIVYLILTAGSGSVLLWSPAELVAGIVIAALIGYATRNIMGERFDYFFNPKRWVLFIILLWDRSFMPWQKQISTLPTEL